jgi:type II secretory ATPase GspE/PulE/Tfp pilus assembly ATPase PilB-like protein
MSTNTSVSPPKPAARVLGQLLLARGALGADLLAKALVEQRQTRERLGEVLVRWGTDPEAVARALADQLRMGYAEPPLRADPAALALVDLTLAARLRIVPLALSERGLRVAMADPLDASALDDLRFRTGRRVEALVAVPAVVAAALGACRPVAVTEILGRMPGARSADPDDGVDESALRRASEAPPIVELVEHMLKRAIEQRASDIHVEPAEDRLRVRARVDGVLHSLLDLPAHVAGAVISRLKIMADLDIAVKRRPQDGRAAARIDGRDLSLRMSTLPAQDGEKIVIRILDASATAQSLDALGMDSPIEARFRALLGRSHGVLLVTGPTGSGKTTTLYAALASLDRDRRNLITLEDPVEYRLDGLTQVQVHARAGLSFGAALRAVLRQDPDVIMVGELRDRETVEIAMAAAMTGHLVLSTLHTNDAPSAATRLAEMGAPPYLVAGGLIGVMAQRLARRLCPHCASMRAPATGELEALALPSVAALPAAIGCSRCDDTGYRGRTGIYELLVVDARVRSLVLRRAPAHAIRQAARADGMTTLGQDAWNKVRAGVTTLEEVRPLLALLAGEAPLCPSCGSDIRPGFLICPSCGHRLRSVCSCGAPLEDAWTRCARCGTEIAHDDRPFDDHDAPDARPAA